MRQNIIAALTPFEISTILSSSAKLLFEIEFLEGTVQLTDSLKKLIVQIFEHEPEHYYETFSSGKCHDVTLKYCIAYKQISDCRYYSDGNFNFDGYKHIALPVWEPKNPSVIKKIQDNTVLFRQRFEQQSDPNNAAILVQDQIKAAEKDFWSELNKTRNAFLKYQMYKFLKKKIKPSKRFFVNGKTLWELADILRMISKQSGNITLLENTVSKAFNVLHSLFQHSSVKLTVNRFNTTEQMSCAYKEKLLYKPHANCRQVVDGRFYESQLLDLLKDPVVDNMFYYSGGKNICNILYSLQQHYENGLLDSELQDFLILNGIIKEVKKDG